MDTKLLSREIWSTRATSAVLPLAAQNISPVIQLSGYRARAVGVDDNVRDDRCVVHACNRSSAVAYSNTQQVIIGNS
jgi:hypothetical protein